ncbi:MAG: peptidoglycan-binding domain-containing protein [Ilumatobacteraceae bacterium]
MEASWHLGDRLLHLTAPNMRGDDVSELQSALARLGFDCGRVDGILGPATTRALADFQRNCGLPPDSVCGPDSVRALQVLTRQSGTGPGVTALRELESLTAARRTLGDLRIVIGQFGGLSGLTRQLARALRQRSATVAPTDEPDAAAQAAAANRLAATVYVGFEARTEPASTICYYAVPTFESVGGRSLAEVLRRDLARVDLDVTVHGMRLAVLRETRMPAVLCTFGPVQRVVDATPAIVDAVVHALEGWADSPLTVPDPD